MIHGRSANMSEGAGGKNLTARNLPDMLGGKIAMEWAPVRALKLPTISICIVFQGEAIGDDGKSPKPNFGSKRQISGSKFSADFLWILWVPPRK